MSQPAASPVSRQKLFLLFSLLPLLPLLLIRQRNRRVKGGDDIISLTLSLAQIASPSGHEQRVFTYAESWLSKHNVTVHTQAVPPLTASHAGRQNLLATHGDIADVQVLLCTHLDTVPGGPSAAVRQGKLVGRGVVDAKGQAAGFMVTFVEMADPRVGLLLVSGEETDHAGMIAAGGMGIPEGVTLVNGEPTEGMLAKRQKGLVRGVVKVVGRRAHSGYPHLGDSAVHKLVDVLVALREVWPAEVGETMNVGVVQGGSAPNVVAGEAEAAVVWRVTGVAEGVVQRVREVVRRFEGVEFVVQTMNDAVELFVPERTGRRFGVTEVAYNTDIPYYGGRYKRAVVFGGGSITVAHTEHEEVDVAEMREFGGRVREVVHELVD